MKTVIRRNWMCYKRHMKYQLDIELETDQGFLSTNNDL